MIPTFRHVNRNVIMSFSIRTTGPNPYEHDIVQVAIMPLDNHLNLYTKVPPFLMDLKPKRSTPEQLSAIDFSKSEVKKSKLMDICLHGIDPYDAADRFDEWFQTLDIYHHRKIIPLTYNWPVKKPFILEWLGFETTSQLISDEARDVVGMANFANDRCSFNSNNNVPFGRRDSLAWLFSHNGIHIKTGNIEEEVMALPRLYKKMLVTPTGDYAMVNYD